MIRGARVKAKRIEARSPQGRKVLSLADGSATMIIDATGHIMGRFDSKAQDRLINDLLASGITEPNEDVVLSRYIAAYWAAASAQGCPT